MPDYYTQLHLCVSRKGRVDRSNGGAEKIPTAGWKEAWTAAIKLQSTTRMGAI